MTQTDVAEASGISKATLSRKLSGKQVFTAEELLALAPILGARASDWMAQAETATSAGAA